ncbi:hypothetical protein [uncultured Clostridium sp.]|jgi:hypothetical protein|uniref:hypothetical protein n=1 Tax=uncultured Clostridium sp. TaxID=59620 RepID=UPI00272C662F|nr:hypothetical protein [uncultured Clostridium sp.]
MKSIVKGSIVTGLLAICLITNVYATQGTKTIKKDILKSEENNFLTTIEQEYIEENKQYELVNYLKTEDEENEKTVTAYKKDIIKTNSREAIIEHFGETLQYLDSEYFGTIDLKDYEIKEINNGKYETIDEKKINFSKYSKNDLDNIEKEKVINGVTYYLINVNWENDETENIDSQEVPVTYKGVMVYQAIVTRNNPFSYEITVTYKGNVRKKDPIYLYTLEYEKVEEEAVVIQEGSKDYIVPTIIISGLGIALVIVYCIGKTTARVYVKTDNGFKLIKVVRLSKKHNTINISNYKHKTITNMFAIKTTNGFYNKNQNMLIKVKKDKFTKNVYLNSAYIDFILG